MNGLQIIVERHYAHEPTGPHRATVHQDNPLFAQENPIAKGQLIVLAFGDGGRIFHMPICGRIEIFSEAYNG